MGVSPPYPQTASLFSFVEGPRPSTPPRAWRRAVLWSSVDAAVPHALQNEQQKRNCETRSASSLCPRNAHLLAVNACLFVCYLRAMIVERCKRKRALKYLCGAQRATQRATNDTNRLACASHAHNKQTSPFACCQRLFVCLLLTRDDCWALQAQESTQVPRWGAQRRQRAIAIASCRHANKRHKERKGRD